MDGASCSHDVPAAAADGGTLSSSHGNPGGFGQQEDDDSAEEDDPSSSSSSSSPPVPLANDRNSTVMHLDNFRQLWRRELDSGLSGCDRIAGNRNSGERNHHEDNARDLYLQGVEAECSGQLYDAIRYYRRAVQLVPDIEFRVADLIPKTDELNVDDNSSGEEDDDDSLENSGENDRRELTVKKHEDLTTRFYRLLSRDGKMCRPFYDQKGSHVSILPSEIILYIFKWVISTELDMRSLEQLSLVCRGFYLCARDTELWRLACLKVWGVNCGSPNKYGSWREMFISRPRLRFGGAYISKTTYVRAGEPAFQDQTYRPWHVVEYYRYLRFFPEGLVFMLTTPEEPVSSLPKLRLRNARCAALLSGHYRIHGDVVTAILKRTKGSESIVPQSTNRYRRVRQIQYHDPGEQTFHLELEITAYKSRTNYKLEWRHYSTHTVYRNGQESVCEFDLSLAKFPPLWFSRVKSYTAFSERPLSVH